MLYQPTADEIATTIQAARDRFPYLGSRLDAAAQLLSNPDMSIDVSKGAWRIKSQTHEGVRYLVTMDGPVSRCACPDFEYRNRAAPQYFCKHILTYHAYRRILSNNLNTRLVGDYDFRPERLSAQGKPGSLITHRSEKGLRAVTFDRAGDRIPRYVCHLQIGTNDTWRFRSDMNAAAFAEWLAVAPNFQRQPSIEERFEAIDRQEIMDIAAMRAAFTGNLYGVA